MKFHWLLPAFLLASNVSIAADSDRGAPVYSFVSKHPTAVLICLHDVWGNGFQFHELGESLAKRYNVSVYSLDQCGYGGNNHNRIDIPKTEESIQDLVQASRKQFGLLPVFILGEGAGGALALDYCLKASLENISGLIMVNLAGSKSMEFKRNGVLYQGKPSGCSKDFQYNLSHDPMAKVFFSLKEINAIEKLLLSQQKNAGLCRSRVLLIVGDSIDPEDRKLCRQIFLKIPSPNKELSVQSGYRNLFEYARIDDSVVDKVGGWLTGPH